MTCENRVTIVGSGYDFEPKRELIEGVPMAPINTMPTFDTYWENVSTKNYRTFAFHIFRDRWIKQIFGSSGRACGRYLRRRGQHEVSAYTATGAARPQQEAEERIQGEGASAVEVDSGRHEGEAESGAVSVARRYQSRPRRQNKNGGGHKGRSERYGFNNQRAERRKDRRSA